MFSLLLGFCLSVLLLEEDSTQQAWLAAYFVNVLNTFSATSLFLYPLKIQENQKFSDTFRGYRKWPVAWNRYREYQIHSANIKLCSY